jgi:hypothetical protein
MKQTYSLNYKLLLPLFVLMMSLSSNYSNAQCGPYQAFESFTNSLTAANLKSGTSAGNLWTVGAGASSGAFTPYSGLNNMRFTSAAGYIVTPKISSVKDFSFYYKATSGAATAGFRIQYATDYDGTNFATANWADIASLPLTTVSNSNLATQQFTTTTYTQISFDLTKISNSPYATPAVPGGSGIHIRINDNRVTGIVFIDDISWTSNDTNLNLDIVAPRSPGTPTSCSVNLAASNLTYNIYDNGGYADNYNVSQTNTITVVPPAGYNAKFSVDSGTTVFTSDATCSDFDWLKTYNGDTTASPLLNWLQTGCASTGRTAIPAAASPLVVTSSDCQGRLTALIKSDATAALATAVGMKITVTMVAAATCSSPSAVTITPGSETADGATVAWSAPCPVPAGYDYYVSTTNSLAGATAMGYSATNSVTITGLSSTTTYYVWIRSNCGGTQSSWVQATGPLTFTTLCGPYGLPYFENFNGLNGPLPVCTSTNTTSGIWKTNLTNGNLYTATAASQNTMFYTKPLSLVAGTTYRLTYDYSTLNGTANFNVYYGTANTIPTATNIATSLVTHTGVSALTSNVVNFVAPSTGTFYIGFKLVSLSIPASTFFNLDNIRLEPETCLPPTAVGHASETTSSSFISWTASASGPSNGYQYIVSTSNTPPGYNDSVNGSTAGTSLTVGSLTANTTYYLWVRSNCGSGVYSAWSAYTQFTTVANPTADVIIMNTTPTIITTTTCNGLFYDGGGAGSNYSDSAGWPSYTTYTYVIKPTAGKKLKVVFSSFSTENRRDGLLIYNGNTTGAPLLSSGLPVGADPTSSPAGSYYGTNSPGTVFSSAADGSLTFKFITDGSVSGPGWAATVSCIDPFPTIASISPNTNSCGATGTVVTITGDHFTESTPISVAFNGTPCTTFTISNNTTILATLPAGATTGPISVANNDATSYSSSAFFVLGAAPVTTGVIICPKGSGSLTSSADCTGYGNSGTSMSGTWSSASVTIANRPTPAANGSNCAFDGSTPRHYELINFQVSATGSYTFTMAPNASYDGMGYITSGAFTPGSCATGVFVVTDDDSGVGDEPVMTVNLTQGITYTLYTTTWDSPSGSYPYQWTVTPPTGQEIMLLTNTVNWYDAPVAGNLIGSGASFNPEGIDVRLLTTDVPAGTTIWYYAACASNTTCRTPTSFVIKAAPIMTLTPTGYVCPNAVKAITATAADSYSWSSAPANSLYSNALGTIPYAGQNISTVYLKTAVDVIVTVVGTNATTTCTSTASTTQSISNKTWSAGAWSGDGLAPTAGEGITINASGTFSDLSGCSCSVTNGNIVVNGNMIIDGDLSVAPGATMTFNDDASLIQINTPASNTNTGNIIYKRTTNMRKMDYTYWSSPVVAQYLYQSSATPPFLDAVSAPLPMQGDKYYWWDTSAYAWMAPTPAAPVSATTMSIGRGYIIRAPLTVDPYVAQPVTFTFTGKPNNGNWSVNIVKGAGANDLNCIGNPYPSAISALKFISQNTAAFGSGAGSGTTLYFWTHNTPLTQVGQNFVYNNNDYATYNYSGTTGTATTGGATPAPNGKIAAGQGFMVKGIFPGTSVATFNNGMRLSGVGDNSFFYRTNHAATALSDDALVADIESWERNRVWLDLTNTDGIFKQILVGYIENATNDFDNGFDGELIDAGNTVGFYSLLQDKRLVIQGKGLPFSEYDTVPLGYKSSIAGSFAIALSQHDGVFDNQAVYLEDKQLGLIHPLNTAPYSFNTEAGTFENRFVLRYSDTSLSVSNPVFDENTVKVVKENTDIRIRTSNIDMKSVQLYDTRGRLIAEQHHVNSNSAIFRNLNIANQVIIVTVTSTDGISVTKKIIF